MKVSKGMYLSIQFGKEYKKQVYSIPIDPMIEVAGEALKFSKSEIKRLVEQGGVKLGLVKDE